MSLVDRAMQNVFEADLNRAMDLVYGVLQMDQLQCCTVLLTQCVPYYFSDPGSLVLHSFRRIAALARLTVQVSPVLHSFSSTAFAVIMMNDI